MWKTVLVLFTATLTATSSFVETSPLIARQHTFAYRQPILFVRALAGLFVQLVVSSNKAYTDCARQLFNNSKRLFLSVRALESWYSNTWLSDDFYFLLLKCVFKCGVDVDHTLASLKCERKYILPLHTQIRFQKHLDYNLRSRFFFLKKELARRERIYNQQLLKNEKSKDYCHNNVYI